MFDIDASRLLAQLTYDPASPMIFSSGIFLWLFLGFSLIYMLLHRADTARIAFVTLFSYYFYYKSSGLYFCLLAFVTVSDFYIGKAIAAVRSSSLNPQLSTLNRNAGQLLVLLSVVIDLSLLGYFKYTNFIGDMLIPDWKHMDIFLPVGVSFFTFQSLSYTIDIYRGRIQPLNRLLDYAFYVSFFPQLVAGPIVRASDFIPQIRQKLVITNEMFGKGLYFIIIGLFKKAVISDYISVNFVERIFDQPNLYTGLENLLGVYGYTLQIYCDFSGYSDMAIGIALILGFQFPMNFDSPYKSKSITEFWRRWHISLSSWLKDYLYISLGGNRHGKIRQYINLFITMLLGGLWHGASLNFIIWGGAHGILLALDKMWHSICPKLSPLTYLNKKSTDNGQQATGIPCAASFPYGGKGRVRGLLFTVITFHLVAALWVLFRAQDFNTAAQVFTQIFTFFHPQVLGQWIESYWGVAILMVLGYTLHLLPNDFSRITRNIIVRMPLLLQALILVLVIWIVIQIKSSDVQPFIYFQF